tara:strand:+ start:647 stop:784 length:138 start_codon:yes stop_codon:yes gene_type:complete
LLLSSLGIDVGPNVGADVRAHGVIGLLGVKLGDGVLLLGLSSNWS